MGLKESIRNICCTFYKKPSCNTTCFQCTTNDCKLCPLPISGKQFHPKTQIGVVDTKSLNRFSIRYAWNLSDIHSNYIFPNRSNHSIGKFKYHILSDKRHFNINLCKFGLSISSEIFISKTPAQLEVPVHTTNHQYLFENLRRLWQCIPLTRMNTRGNQIISGTFWGRPIQNRSFNFIEIFLI